MDFIHRPSPLAGEGGAKCRMRGRSDPSMLALRVLNHTPHPSCADGGASHLLPQGEKEFRFGAYI